MPATASASALITPVCSSALYIKAFEKGVTCLCCMGGNCHAVGHILDICDCFCTPRRIVAKDEDRAVARMCKYVYFDCQRQYVKEQEEEYLDGTDFICRRFICTIDGRCREEPGCGRSKVCGDCYLKTGQWDRGRPFLPYWLQLRWINEFLKWAQEGATGRRMHEVAIVSVSSSSLRGIRVTPTTLPSGGILPESAEEATFGFQISPFPTRRPIRRHLPTDIFLTDEAQRWFVCSKITLGPLLSSQQKQAIALLYLWKDLFVEDVKDLPETDLVCHTIPTYPGARPYRAKDPIYAADEVRWQSTMLPEMMGTVVQPGTSPWAAKTTWVSKKDTTVDSIGRWPLRMVHTYCPLNNSTIKTNYPMKRIEPILEDLARPGRQYFFSADAAYGFYAVPIYPPHAYKTAFNSILGQFYYTRMPMGLTGAPATYARLKDITFGPIPGPNSEPPLIAALEERKGQVGFRYFFDDDYGAANTFEDMMWFLQEWYFPRVKWAKLTLKPSKSSFFTSKIDPLGMTVDARGLRASDKKQDKITNYPTPRSEKEIDDFLYLTTYLKALIPGRTEHARILKEAVIRDRDSPTRKKGKAIGFNWTQKQQESFDYIKKAVIDNVIVGGDPTQRYYLSVCAGKYGFGSVLFQLDKADEVRWREGRINGKEKGFPKGKERVVQFIAQAFTDIETRYLDIERECLALLRSLEEVRFMVLNSQYPVTVFSDTTALVNLLGKDDSKGRIAGWRVRISEYNIEPRNVKIKDMAIADGLARMPYESMDQPRIQGQEWEDVCTLQTREHDGMDKHEGAEVGRPERQYISCQTDTFVYHHDTGTICNNNALVVYCDGACRKSADGAPRGTIGVYFGPNDPNNFGAFIPTTLAQTNQVSELLALLRAIERGVARIEKTIEKVVAGDEMVPRRKDRILIVATDSEYAYKGITEWIYKWKEEGVGHKIRNFDLFLEIDLYLQMLERRGLRVLIWRIPREFNVGADSIACEMQERRRDQGLELTVVSRLAEDNPAVEKWDKWLKDSWYTDVVTYLCFGSSGMKYLAKGRDDNQSAEDQDTKGQGGNALFEPKLRDKHIYVRRLRKVKSDAKKFMLSDQGLLYKETNGVWSRCITREEVGRVLHRFHDLHGHFAIGVMSGNLLGKYYWPGRMKDVAQWCQTCESCQRLGPRRIITSPKSIMSLQPMDMMGMDFLGPISPHSRSGSIYIILAVDYFSRFLFAHATQRNTGEAVVRFLEDRIVRVFGWPLAFYCDNGSHFVKGLLPEKLKQAGVKLFTAPVSNPQSVGLAERYVQLVLAGLRAVIQAEIQRQFEYKQAQPAQAQPKKLQSNSKQSKSGLVQDAIDPMSCWDEYLDGVVHAINTRILAVHGFTPSQLLLGFNARIHPLDELVAETMRKEQLTKMAEEKINGGVEEAAEIEELKGDSFKGASLEGVHYELRLACLEEIRELTRERVIRYQEQREILAPAPRHAPPKVGDLVLRRRFVVDKHLGMKLHAKWEGPYKLVRISQTGTSGEIEDLKTGRQLGRYAFNTLKVYVAREESPIGGEAQQAGREVQWISMEQGLGELCGRLPRRVDFAGPN